MLDSSRIRFIIITMLLVLFSSSIHHEAAKLAPVKKVSAEQLRCLAANIYYEAGAESTEGKAAVAHVVLNRVKHGFAKSLCAVVYQRIVVKNDFGEPVQVCQFSWTCENLNKINERSERYLSSMRVAYDVAVNDAYSEVVPRSTLFFHNTQVRPEWKYRRVKQIGNHIFYRK